MKRADFARQHALRKPPVARAQDRVAGIVQFQRHAQPWRQNVPHVQRPESGHDLVRLVAGVVHPRQVLAERAAAIVANPGVDSEAIADGDGVRHEKAGRQECRSCIRRIGVRRADRIGTGVREAHAGRDDHVGVVLAALDLSSHLPRVVRAPHAGTVVIQRRFADRPDQRQAIEARRGSAPDAGRRIEEARRRRVSVVGRRIRVVVEPSDPCFPHRSWRHGVGEVAEGERRYVRMVSRRRLDRRVESSADPDCPELLVEALLEPPARRQVPRQLREDLVLLILPGQVGIGSWLAVVIAQVLVAAEEPQAVAIAGPPRLVVKSR